MLRSDFGAASTHLPGSVLIFIRRNEPAPATPESQSKLILGR